MTWKRQLVKVEDLDIGQEPENADTWMRVYPYDGCGAWNTENTKRLIVWVDSEDQDEYPEQHGVWYERGTEIPLEVWVDQRPGVR